VTNDDRDEHSGPANDLVRFFRALSPDARSDYDALAVLDREFGEDITAERRARDARAGSQ
jgi:hypothetical protein